jgi:hypothetical protein
MSRFRACTGPLAGAPLYLEAVRRLLADVLAPRHFFIGPNVQLEWEHQDAEECAWEIFQGRLLDPTQTRERAAFEDWNVFLIQDGVRSGEPLLSLKLAESGRIYVVRGLECHVWEGYDSGGNVFLSRERRKWVRELIEVLHLEQIPDLDALRDELMCSLFHAVVGTSRLPLSSVEAPLPLFSFGELFYCYRSAPEPAGPWRGWQGLLEGADVEEMGPAEERRWLESVLRAIPRPNMQSGLTALRRQWLERGRNGRQLLRLCLSMFNDVSLSPYHDLGDRIVRLLDSLAGVETIAVADQLDFLASLLIQLGRHLTAYDLVTFHHRGANYPDALLLDTLLKSYLGLIERFPELLTGPGDDVRKQRRRRALRQGWLLRRFYEGHLVPDAPTSPGENNRVLPGQYQRVPEEQILQPTKRRRVLYDGDPLPAHLGPNGLKLLRESVRDLQTPEELQELGLAVYLDRPLGDAKAPAEPDRTLLLSSLAFGRSVCGQRLQFLKREPLLEKEVGVLDALETADEPAGLPVQQIGPARRPTVVSLADAHRAAADFVFLYTLPGSQTEFLRQFDLRSVSRWAAENLSGQGRILLARSPRGDSLLVYDDMFRSRLELRVDASAGYAVRANTEYPVAGLLARSLDEGARAEPVRLLWGG